MPELRTIDPDDDGARVDRWFKRHYPHVTHTLLEKLLRKGEVRLDGKRAKAADRIAAGQAMRLPPQVIHAKPPQKQKPEAEPKHLLATKDMGSLADRILYMDKQVIVIDKPPGLATQGGSGLTRHVDGMLESLQYEKPTRPKLVHRLDRDTSGVLLIARSPGVAAKLAASFRGRDMEKTYWAVVAGRPLPVEGRIDQPLKRVGGDRGERTAMAERDDPEGARAVTDYQTLDHAAQKLAWLELKPITGRTHQLRVHCVAIRAPILGDIKYQQPDQNDAFLATIEGLSRDLHLHARALHLPHPSGGWLTVEADLPPHMADTFSTLGFHAPAAQPPFRSGR